MKTHSNVFFFAILSTTSEIPRILKLSNISARPNQFYLRKTKQILKIL